MHKRAFFFYCNQRGSECKRTHTHTHARASVGGTDEIDGQLNVETEQGEEAEIAHGPTHALFGIAGAVAKNIEHTAEKPSGTGCSKAAGIMNERRGKA